MIVRSCLVVLLIIQSAFIADGCSSNIQNCTNCYGSENKCTKDEVKGKQGDTIIKCVEVIDLEPNVQIVSWLLNEKKCYRFTDCQENTSHLSYRANATTRHRVCHSNCLSVHLKMEEDKKGHVATPNNSVIYSGLENAEECMAHCIRNTSCVSSFNGNDNKECLIYNSCSPCSSIYTVGFITYTWICVDSVQSGCPELQHILHGYVYTSGLNIGDTASYACELGYTLPSSSTRFCTSNGTWNSSEPACDLITCPTPLAPINGSLILNGSSFLDHAIYLCDIGYYLSSFGIATCNASGLWDTTAPTCIIHDCGNLSNPDNGFVNIASTTYGAIANYTCDAGYNLNGSNSNTCNGTGVWNRRSPTCTLINCGPMLNPSNGNVSYSSTTYASVANYSCNIGYFLNGSRSTMCAADGHWLNLNPGCTLYDCGPLNSPNNGTVNMTNTTYGAIAIYSCDSGYFLAGSYNNTCNATGKWNNAAPVCSRIVCGNITITNGLVSYSGATAYGDHAEITCDAGYQLNGPSTRTCFGIWSQPESSCIAIGATTLTTAKPTNVLKNLYIMPCICNTEAEWGNLTNDEIIQTLVKELTIDPSQTTVERSKRESRQDHRVSSANMGRLAIAVILIILAAVIIPDLITLWRALNRWRN